VFRRAPLGKILFACAVATPHLAGCEARNAPEAVFDSTLADAEFRWWAGQVYDALNRESCEPDPALRRSVLLAQENEAVRTFERRLEPTSLGAHLSIARSDSLYRLAAENGCSADSDPRFARLHVQRARDDARIGLERMETLASPLAASLPAVRASARRTAQFRYLVRGLVEASQPRCILSNSMGNDDIMAPARAELDRFRSRLQGTEFAIQYEIAEADVAYDHEMTMVECADPAPTPPAELSRNALEAFRRQIARLESLV
jgi:hypothetical protein